MSPPSQVKDPNSLPKPQQAVTINGPTPANQPPVPSSVHGRPVYPQHPSVNPLLLSLKEQLLQVRRKCIFYMDFIF